MKQKVIIELKNGKFIKGEFIEVNLWQSSQEERMLRSPLITCGNEIRLLGSKCVLFGRQETRHIIPLKEVKTLHIEFLNEDN